MDCIAVFAGCGGATLGLCRAGFRHVLAIEMDPYAALSHMTNFPGVPVSLRNLYLWSFAEVCQEHGIGPGFDGLVWLSPPCQGFSSGGKKQGAADIRNRLLFVAADAAQYMPSAWIVVENVKGLTKGNALPIYEEFLHQLEEGQPMRRTVTTYEIRALDFGAAQDRNRVFIVAAPAGMSVQLGEIRPPSPKPQPRTFADATMNGWHDHDPDFPPLTDNELPIYADIPDGGNWQDSAFGRRYAQALGVRLGQRKAGFLLRMATDKPSHCCVASLPGETCSRCDFVHPTKLRYISIGEQKELMELPASFLLAGPIKERWRQAGNAVMPFMAELVGRRISAIALKNSTKPFDS